MRYFNPSEFQGWHEHLSNDLKTALDTFRDLRGKPVLISPARGAVGRRMPQDRASMHNFNRWGKVHAVDVFPVGTTTADDRLTDVIHALRAGFTGIGVYPEWRNGRGRKGGLHLDVRHAVQASHGYQLGRDFHADPALWSGFPAGNTQTYGPIDAAMPPGVGRLEILNLANKETRQ